MKVLVLGSGGREHALAWKIQQSPRCEKILVHPGNAGTVSRGFSKLSGPDNMPVEEIARAAKEMGIELVVIGPEGLLAQGYANFLRKAGFQVFGPDQFAAQLESSKIFAKEFMTRGGIPTAPYLVTDDDRELLLLATERHSWPVVLKLDGLAAGKGVVIAESARDVEDFATRIWVNKEFGPGPHQILIEEFILGRELSYIGICDGETFVPLASATDFKRINDGNLGPNTGGMGSISPSPYFSEKLEKKIQERIIDRILKQFKSDGMDYRGALYVGLMIDDNDDPHVLEFNARFGDPETQALVLRLDSDLIDLLSLASQKDLKSCPKAKWTAEVSLYVVAAAEGYPGKVRTGDPISGLEALAPKTTVFFSGVATEGNHLVTGGGRVLGLGTLAASFESARTQLYRDLKRVHWHGIHYRNDIGG